VGVPRVGFSQRVALARPRCRGRWRNGPRGQGRSHDGGVLRFLRRRRLLLLLLLSLLLLIVVRWAVAHVFRNEDGFIVDICWRRRSSWRDRCCLPRSCSACETARAPWLHHEGLGFQSKIPSFSATERVARENPGKQRAVPPGR